MYTLKIAWTLHEYSADLVALRLVDEQTLFIPAQTVTALNSYVEDAAQRVVKQWQDAGCPLFDYSNVRRHEGGESGRETSRMIKVDLNGDSTWYLASRAWLLGPDGGTIERIAP